MERPDRAGKRSWHKTESRMSFLRQLFQQPELRPDQLNENNQVTDQRILNRDRIKFGASGVLQLFGLTALNTVIIRALGGGQLHLGIIGSLGGFGIMFEWLGAVLLRKTGSCRKAETIVILFRLAMMLLLALVLLAAMRPEWRMYCLWGFLAVSFCLLAGAGLRSNVETTWIGDLVPKQILGWFTGIKFFMTVLGALVSSLLVGYVADIALRNRDYELRTYAAMAGAVALLYAVALVVVNTITDRKPKSIKFFGNGKNGPSLNYASPALWAYIAFFFMWTSGRGALACFTTAYLLDLHYSMTKIMMILVIQNVVAAVMVLVMGKVTDRFGTRLPLIIVSFVIASSMMLWVSSAWFGIYPILIYQVLGGVAGNTHSMLAVNYGQEIFPTEGRAGYFGFSRIFVGIAMFVGTLSAGVFMHHVHWSAQLWGATLNSYHLLFFLCSLVPMCCVIPLILIGKRTVQPKRIPDMA